MTDHQLDSDSAPQRKRIAVACGRCRKRKIRCSGDPGQGQPCTNCKNAGAEPCQFLRVASREAPLRHEPGDFGYSVGDARLYAGRTSVANGMQYTQDLPTLGSSDMLGSYRGGSSYGYTPASKTYYPAMHAYGTPYADDSEFGLGVPSSQSVLNPEPVGILPGQWSSGARAKAPSFSSIYMDTDASYSSYNDTNLVHRSSHTINSDSPSFSFSGVAASLPLTSAPGSDRLLPNPAGRSSALPYPAVKSSIPGSSTSTANTLADVATAASYANGFEATSLAYQASTTTSSLASHPSSSSRTNSDTYSATESIFSDQERSLHSQGSAFDMNTYTAEPRRGSEITHEAAAAATHPHSSQHYIGAAAYLSDASAGSHAHRHGQAVAASGSGTTHADDRHAAAVATRH